MNEPDTAGQAEGERAADEEEQGPEEMNEQLMLSRRQFLIYCQIFNVEMDDNMSRMMAPYLLINLQKHPTRIVDMNEPKYPVRGLMPTRVTALVTSLEQNGWRYSFATNNIVLNMPDR